MVYLTEEELNYLIRQANKMGHLGQRVKQIFPLPMNATESHQSFAWDTDYGPESATEDW